MPKEFMDIGIPPQITIHKGFQQLRITRKWFDVKYIYIAPFAFIWNAFLFFWYKMALPTSDIDWLFLLFPMLHVGMGIWLTYYVLTGLFNKTVIDSNQAAASAFSAFSAPSVFFLPVARNGIPSARSISRAWSSLLVLVTKVMSKPRVRLILSSSISGKMD